MKQIVCEMCGGTDLLKQDGVFVCQSCGTKYSVEEAKKMMVEGTVEIAGTVQIDNSDKLENLYELAQRAKNNGDYEKAEKYYSRIQEYDPNDWEANFYSVYCSLFMRNINEIPSIVSSLINCINSTFSLIQNSKDSIDENYQSLFIKIIYNDCYNYYNLIHKALTSNLGDFENLCQAKLKEYSRECTYANAKIYLGLTENLQTEHNSFVINYVNNIININQIFLSLGDSIQLFFGDKDDMRKISIESWKCFIISVKLIFETELFNEWINKDDNRVLAKKMINDANVCICKIKTFDSSYTQSELPDLPEPPAQPQVSSSSGGCYIATAIYGSYDCPQVWTLRRYRDNTLSTTWHGRLFIHAYYAISPTLVRCFGNTSWFKRMWQGKLDRMVARLQAGGIESTPYEDQAW